ncbi:MAG: Gldg family protein [Promethearchaeota archaeon]
MPFLKKATVLFDLAHNEMLNIEDNEYSEFSKLLERLSVKIRINENYDLTKKILKNIDILILGNPIDDYFSNIEINDIINFVREGGNLLIISEYGADYLQKTNINDISNKYFGIFFKKNIVKESNKINQNCSSILTIENFEEHKITNQLREIIIGGTCSLILTKNSKPLLKSNDSAWTEIFDDSSKKWKKDEIGEKQIIAAYSEFGKGKVVAIGDIDLFSNNENIGINQFDNRKFIFNILNWLVEPVKEGDVILFILNQLGIFQNEIKELNLKVNNIIESITFLEHRVSSIEDEIKLKKKSKNLEKNHEKKALSEEKITYF